MPSWFYKKKDCQACRSVYFKKYREKNKEKINALNKKNRHKRKNILIEEKICVNHGKIEKENIDKWHRCRLCIREKNKIYYKKKSNTWLSRQPHIRKEKYDPVKRKEYRLRYEKKLNSAYEEKRKIRDDRYRNELSDGYVKFLSARKYKIQRTLIPDWLVSIERNIQLIKRKLRCKET